MAGKRKNSPGSGMPLRVALAVLMLVLCAALLFRERGTPAQSETPKETVVPSAPTVLPASPEEDAPLLTEPPAETPAAEGPLTEELPPPESEAPAASPAPPAPPAERKPIYYDQRSYQLVSDMIFAYKNQVKDKERIIAADVAALKDYAPDLGEAWGGIMEFWDYANTRMELQYEGLPDDLPGDDSLCIVVLGFQLQPEGDMAMEMLGRCELALKAAEKYPNAFLAVTGGGTAFRNHEVTEAGVMADWFLARGIAPERLILEDSSSTTDQNARYTLQILTERYPQVKSLVIVSSDYHLPLGCLLFTEASLLYGCETGRAPFKVVSNLALRGYGLNEYKNPAEQALYVWALADPQMKS